MIQSLMKAANILEFMKIQNKDYTIAEISEAINMPPSTTHRILNTLIKCEFVSKDDRTHLYKLGPGLISLGMAATNNISLQNEAMPILKELSAQTEEDSFLVIKSGNSGVIIGKAEGLHSLKVVENFGREIALHKGAVRKVILAYQSEEFIREYISRELEPYLGEDKLNSEKLLKDLEDIKENGVSISISEYINNTMGIGAPIFNYKGDFVASIGIAAPLYRAGQHQEKLVKEIKKSADKLSKKLGYF
ncbi:MULTISPECIES: IclR family transcriptional regulator [Peptoniphilus]|uniref:IclR family transcriptional regulator n=1 Tax=Peptoniphilus TaxID=162289 RepID=UPI00030583B7|nr:MULTISPECIES: IclR family transcriptional regulator [Peptoniphilus]